MAHHAYGHAYDPNCPHCTPAILDPKTGEVLAKDHPVMKIVMQLWSTAPFEQRRAFIAVTADNSREPHDVFNGTPREADSGRHGPIEELMEYGPLRHVQPDFDAWPSWMYLDHGPIPHVTHSDHRAEDGTIVPLGTPCLVSRQGKVLTHALEDGRLVLLDGDAWVIDGAPTLDPGSCLELLLCA